MDAVKGEEYSTVNVVANVRTVVTSQSTDESIYAKIMVTSLQQSLEY